MFLLIYKNWEKVKKFNDEEALNQELVDMVDVGDSLDDYVVLNVIEAAPMAIQVDIQVSLTRKEG